MSNEMSTGVSSSGLEKVKEEGRMVDVKYNDETADLLLISSDGVRFYVEKFYVLAVSSVMRGMIKACTARPAEVQFTDDEFERAPILRLLLDLACGHPVQDIDVLPHEDVFNLLRLCDKYDCATPLLILKLATSRPLTRGMGGYYHALFFFACIMDDLETAFRLLPSTAARIWDQDQAALGPAGEVGGASLLDLTAMSTSWLDRLPRKYFLALQRASRLRHTTPQGSWQSVADDFKLQVKLQETPSK